MNVERDNSILVITELEPELAPPGIQRRFNHIYDHYVSQGVEVEQLCLAPALQNQSSKIQRVQTILRARKLAAARSSSRRVTVLGLGAPHMLLIAWYLVSCSGARSVIYDVCDSWLLQVKARASTGDARLLVPVILGSLIALVTPRNLRLTYISHRDERHDRMLNRGKSFSVIPPTAPSVLKNLSPVGGRIDRIVVTADYTAFHNSKGMDNLIRTWDTFSADHPEVRLDLYGKGWHEPLQRNVTYKGWAADITEVYEGNTAIFIPNVGGSGVANKLIEAIASGRPTIIHCSVAQNVGLHSDSLVYGGKRTLLNVLNNVAAYRPSGPESDGQL